MCTALRPIAALVLLAVPLAAQEPAPKSSELRTLEERARDQLHPNEDPLEIVGREQAGNDLRARTPALARSDRVAAAIDPVAAHERALALYAEGARFHSPPAPANQPMRELDAGQRLNSAGDEAEVPATELAPWWRSSLPAFLVGIFVLLFLYRRHADALR